MEQIIPFRRLPFRHRFMFAQVMSDPVICKLFLEKLLGIEIDHIVYIDTEKNVEGSSRFHGIRLDVYLKDGAGTVYNIEMQVEKVTAPLKRPRYYQSQIDRRLLSKGCSYHTLPDTFIIFICDFDYFGAGLAVYERESRVKGTDIPYNDGTHVYILNSRYEEGNSDQAILESLDYIRTDDAHLEYHSELAQRIIERVDAVRQDEQMEGVYMSTELLEMELREKGREEGLKEGMEKGLKEGMGKGMEKGMETTLLTNIRCLIETMQLSTEQAMRALRVPEEDQARLSAQL